MSIRAKLAMGVALALLLSVAGVVQSLVMRSLVLQQGRRHEVVSQIATRVLALNVLRADYQLYRGERARIQWESEHRELSLLLGRAEDLYPDDDPVVRSIRRSDDQRVNLFRSLVATYGAEEAGRLDPLLARDTEERLTGALLVGSQSVIEDTDLLMAQSLESLADIQALAAALTIGFTALLAFLISMLAFLARDVLTSLKELEAGAGAVGRGDLDYRIDLERNDELGRVAGAFDRMTEELRGHRERLEDLVERRTEELRRANLELDSYAKTVSHDLRGPLSAAILANALLADSLRAAAESELREELAESSSTIGKNLEAANLMITGLLEVAKAGQVPGTVTDVPVSVIVAEILDERRALIEEKGIDFDVDESLGTIRGDPVQVRQVFDNLVNNAMVHNDNPSPRVTVQYLGSAGGQNSYLVCDNGSGFKERDVHRLFEISPGRGEAPGAGIGLALVEKVIRAYGGWIKAYNRDGACVEFEFPDWPEP